MSWTTLGEVKNVQQKGQQVTFEGERAKIKLYVLHHDLVRIRFAPDGKFPEDRSWAVVKTSWKDSTDKLMAGERSRWKPFPYELNKDKDLYRVRTQKLTVEVKKSSGLFTFYRGKEFIHDDCHRDYYGSYPGMTRDDKSGAVFCTKTLTPDEILYGLGEKSGEINKRGRLWRMFNHDAFNYNSETSDPLYKHIPFLIGLRQGKAWGIFFNNTYKSEFDLGSYLIDRFCFRAEGGELDYYFFSGPSIAGIINRYTELTGRPLLPPKYTLGYLGSGMSYTEVDDADKEIRSFVDKTFKYDIPCDAFHLSSGYTTGRDGQRYVFNWNRKKLPNPELLIEYCHKNGIKLSANIKPGILKTHPLYDEAVNAGLFIRDEKGKKPFVGLFWGGDASYIDFSNPDSVKWWKENLKKSLFDKGIDSTWNDNCEYDIEGDHAHCHDEERFSEMIGFRSIQPLLMSKTAFEAHLENKPDYRPWVLSRSGFTGIQRYAQIWSGDNNSSFHSLKFSIPLGLGMGLSGVPNNGHDVGGLACGIPGPELLVRWVENGIFQPRFCIHSSGEPPTEPWMYPEMTDKIRKLIKLRYQMLPYLYSLFFEASQCGVPIQRPLVFEFQQDPKTWDNSFDFMFGPSLLVANVYEGGTRERAVYLPAGTGWTNWWTEGHYQGGQEVTVPAPLGQPPVFVRDGAIIPMCIAQKWIDRKPLKELTVQIYPKTDGSFSLFEDDGQTFAYRKGKYLLTEFSCHVQSKKRLNILVKRRKKGFVSPERKLIFRLHGVPRPGAVRLNDEILPERLTGNKIWFYKKGRDILEVKFPDTGMEFRLSIIK